MRWLQFKNQGSSEVPAYGAMEVVGIQIEDTHRVVALCQAPDEDNLPANRVMFNLDCAVGAGKYGVGTCDYPTWALTLTSSPSVGDKFGTENGAYTLKPGGTGFICLGTVAGRMRVKADVPSKGQCPPDGLIYSLRYECEDNPSYTPPSPGEEYDCCDHTNPKGYLYEYLDFYTWDDIKCEWVLTVADEYNRIITCCDPECAENDPPCCEPAADLELVVEPDFCCDSAFNVTVNIGGYAGSCYTLPFKLELYRKVSPGTYALAQTYEPAGGNIATHNFVVTETCTGIPPNRSVDWKVIAYYCTAPNVQTKEVVSETDSGGGTVVTDCPDPDCDRS